MEVEIVSLTVFLTVTFFILRLFLNKLFISVTFLMLFFIFSKSFYEQNLLVDLLHGFSLGLLFSMPILFIDLYSKTASRLFFPKLKSVQIFFSLDLLVQLLKLDYFSYIYSYTDFFNGGSFSLDKMSALSFDMSFQPLVQLLFLSLFTAIVFTCLVLISNKSINNSFFKISSLVIVLFVFVQSFDSYNSIFKEIVDSQKLILDVKSKK